MSEVKRGPWKALQLDDGTVHVAPLDDLVAHELTPDCVCGVATEHVPNPDGPDGWMLTHQALDGRE